MKYRMTNIRIVQGTFTSGKRQGQTYKSMTCNLFIEGNRMANNRSNGMLPIYTTLNAEVIKPYEKYAKADPTNANRFTVDDKEIEAAMNLPKEDPNRETEDLIHFPNVYRTVFQLEEPYARMNRTTNQPVKDKNGNYIISRVIEIYEGKFADNETGEMFWINPPEVKRDEMLQLYYKPLRELLPTVPATGGASNAGEAPNMAGGAATMTAEQLQNAVNNL